MVLHQGNGSGARRNPLVRLHHRPRPALPPRSTHSRSLWSLAVAALVGVIYDALVELMHDAMTVNVHVDNTSNFGRLVAPLHVSKRQQVANGKPERLRSAGLEVHQHQTAQTVLCMPVASHTASWVSKAAPTRRLQIAC
jgi:hypothetical protein